jgi:AcrR family transcriptional regulator
MVPFMPRTRTPPSPTGTVPGRGGPRSEATRRTILDVARRTFAARGYEQTTIRAVAAEAEIDASMVMRYFGSKAELFAAASTSELDPPDLRDVPRKRRGEHMARHFIERWDRDGGDDSLVFLLRTAVTNESVAAQMQSRFNELVLEPIAALGLDRAERRAALIGAQLLGVALCRHILHLRPIATTAADDLIANIGPVVQRHLDNLPVGQ